MKKKRNIVCSILLITVLLISAMPSVYGYSLNDNPSEEEMVEILTQAGIIEPTYEDLKNDAVTRGLIVRMALVSAGYSPDWMQGNSNQMFFDVFSDNENFLFINYAYANGIINGVGNGTFRPDDEVTLIEALAILMRAFGYKVPAEVSGGYESAYANIGTRQGFLKGIKRTLDEGITYSDAVRLIYNALNASSVKTNTATGEYYIDAEETYFNSIYGIYGYEGIVEQNSYGGLYTSTASREGYVMIEGEEFKVCENKAEPELGTRVRVYYTEDGDDKKIVSFTVKNTDILKIDAEDVTAICAGELKRVKNNKTETEKISDKAVVIINNMPVFVSIGKIAIPFYGEFELIDNNNDKVYDIVKITDALLSVVSQVDYTNGEIFSKWASVGKICTEDYKNCVIIKKDGTQGFITDIGANDMIKIVKSADCEKIVIYIITELKQVTVRSINYITNERGDICYELESDMGECFTTAASFGVSEEKAPEPGYNYLFYIDEKGRVAAISSEQSGDSYKYGYLIKCGLKNNLAQTVQAKIYTAEGQFVIFDLCEKIATEEGSEKKRAELFAKEFESAQIVRYALNGEGKIRFLEYAKPGRNDEGFRTVGRITETLTRDDTKYYKSSGLIGGKFAIAPKTRVFVVPSADEIDNEDKYSTYDYSYFGDQRFYPNSIGYGATKDSVEADVVLRRWSQTVVNTDALALLFVKFSEELNKDTGEYDNYIYGYLNGKEMKYKMAPSLEKSYTTVDGETLPIESGDCIRVAFNPENEADTIKLIFDVSDNRVYGNNDTDDTSTRYGSQFRCIFGKFEKRYGDYYSFINYNDSEAGEELYKVDTSYVYIVDMSKKEKYRFTVSDKNSISTIEENPTDASNVFVFYNYATVKIAVLYKQ